MTIIDMEFTHDVLVDHTNNIPMELWALYVDSEAGVGGAIDTHDRLASTCGSLPS